MGIYLAQQTFNLYQKCRLLFTNYTHNEDDIGYCEIEHYEATHNSDKQECERFVVAYCRNISSLPSLTRDVTQL